MSNIGETGQKYKPPVVKRARHGYYSEHWTTFVKVAGRLGLESSIMRKKFFITVYGDRCSVDL